MTTNNFSPSICSTNHTTVAAMTIDITKHHTPLITTTRYTNLVVNTQSHDSTPQNNCAPFLSLSFIFYFIFSISAMQQYKYDAMLPTKAHGTILTQEKTSLEAPKN